ncbi:MAG: ADP-ribosylglycohydrolase family protein [Candidatus Limiplasma sp.]|nr:ADP-ribosylglycohydrolase family protein [Candidatus Limiplasma sp.]MEA5145260.1 ADP-ribosylglycohydrolase family protein [Candidatus Limiplasma sp.]
MLTPTAYLHQVYAGFLGMNIGIRLGAPVEPAFWSYERIRQVYGDIRGYVKPFKHFAADDDANGPVFFLRALDDAQGQPPTPQAVAEAWLNYAREGVGLYWWGGYGVSTEHTAYINLKNGIPAPRSGSIAQNGQILAEQIGGQIFIDTWGLIAPGDPVRAAKYAVAAASVSHDGDGLHGAAFMAACIAQAFITADVAAIIQAGLDQIPADCCYAQVVHAVQAFHDANPDDWRACRMMLEQSWGYDRYPGVCHIIPNAGVCALALYYGQGNFARTVEIATMCSWDTDCNAGNVGTILGVACGLAGLPDHYRAPINDWLALSGISGYLNCMDIPSYCRELAAWGYRMRNEPIPEICLPAPAGETRFDFRLPGSTHGLTYRGSANGILRRAHDQDGVELLLDRMTRGQGGRIVHTILWRRKDFDDERYMPVFSPTAYPGQTVTWTVAFDQWHGELLSITPYALEAFSGKEHRGQTLLLRDSCPAQPVRFIIPDLAGDMVGEVGLHVEAGSPAKFFDAGRVLVSGLHIGGAATYTLRVGHLPQEFGSIVPFSHNHGAWSQENGRIHALADQDALAMTGNYFVHDVQIRASVGLENGQAALLALRVQGAQRGYMAGLYGKDQAAILKNDHGYWRVLAQAPFPCASSQLCDVTFTAQGDSLSLHIDQQALLTVRDADYAYGMVGYALPAMSRATFGDINILEGDHIPC